MVNDIYCYFFLTKLALIINYKFRLKTVEQAYLKTEKLREYFILYNYSFKTDLLLYNW